MILKSKNNKWFWIILILVGLLISYFYFWKSGDKTPENSTWQIDTGTPAEETVLTEEISEKANPYKEIEEKSNPFKSSYENPFE